MEKQKILEFIKDIRNGNAQGALQNLKEIVSAKQKQREHQILTDLGEE